MMDTFIFVFDGFGVFVVSVYFLQLYQNCVPEFLYVVFKGGLVSIYIVYYLRWHRRHLYTKPSHNNKRK